MNQQRLLTECTPKAFSSILANHIDHTYLKPTAQWSDIEKICTEAIENGFVAICIPGFYVKQARDFLNKSEQGKKVKLATVVGFPLGYSTKETKGFEALQAIMNGADEIDMVINIGQLKQGNTDVVLEEIKHVKHVCGDKELKVIVECCYLTDEEIVTVTHVVKKAGADYIKTSTGFGSRGAAQTDIEIFRREEPSLKIKAAGGVRDAQTGLKYVVDFGVSRIGTSSGVELCKQEKELHEGNVASEIKKGSY